MTASFEFESGILGTGTWCFTVNDDMHKDRTVITGEKGKIEFSFFDLQPIEVITGQKQSEIILKHPPHVQQPMIQTVVDDLLGKGSCSSTGDSAARSNTVLAQVLNQI